MSIPAALPFSRRRFLTGLAACGILELATPALGSAASLATLPTLPTRGYYLLRGAYVLTMDAALGELPVGDVLVREGLIEQVGRQLTAPHATVLDGTGMLVLPGLVDTHWHLWTSLLRGLAGQKAAVKYFEMMNQIGPHYTPADTYLSTRLGLAEALFSGITHVHDWSHNTLSSAHVEASLRALRETGIRGRFSLGTASGQPIETPLNLNLFEQLHRNWNRYASDNLLTLGLASPGPTRPTAAQEIATARRLNRPISVHAGRQADNSDRLSQLRDYLQSDLQVVHGTRSTEPEFRALATAGTTFSISPYSELRIGYGVPPLPALLASGITLGLSVDTTPLTGNADMFGIMKLVLNLADGLIQSEMALSARRVVEMATSEGARSMGLGHLIGSLTPGKRADIIMVKLQAPNLGVLTDPYHLLVTAAQPANVDTVLVDGRLLKRAGRLTTLDSASLNQAAAPALAALLQRSKW